MPALTADRFDGGLDVRQLASSADANRLRVLENAYVTTGRAIKKRDGLRKTMQLSSGTVGLYAGLNRLWTFSTTDVDHNLPGIENAKLDDPTATGLKSIVHSEVFNGFLYVAAEYKNGEIRHHYLDGNKEGTLVTDENCPHEGAFTKKANKIFCIKNDVVRFSATSDARDWTTEEDAGFLPVSVQQTGASSPCALGEYQSNLVVFFSDSAQIWFIDPDPKNHRLVDTVPIGTGYQFGHANMSGDIFFLSPSGFRSIAVQSYSNNLMDNDIGSPIDALILYEMRQKINPFTVYYRGGGQLFCFVGDKAYVYSFSRSAKVSAWSIWQFHFTLDYITEFNSNLHVRSGNNVYVFDAEMYTDNGLPIKVTAELPYLDCKSPGILKQFTGVDVAASGSLDLSFKFNPLRPEMETQPLHLRDDSRPLPRIPVEVMATNLAIKIQNTADEPFELAAVTLYYENLTGFGT